MPLCNKSYQVTNPQYFLRLPIIDTMDTATITDFLIEIAYLLIVFGAFFMVAVVKGKQLLINIILGLYFALLLSLEFPYYKSLIGNAEAGTESIVRIAIFTLSAGVSVWLFNRLMPRAFDEKAFEGLGMKLLFAAGATILVMIYTYHALPLTEFITPGSPIQTLFAPEQFFFWWLITPIAILFLL